MSQEAWKKIFETHDVMAHDFSASPFFISAQEIKEATRSFVKTRNREPRILCKQDTRESRPEIFQKNNLFILPVKNGYYAILQGEGYFDIPEITSPLEEYKSSLGFSLETSQVGNSEMQHLDFAYANSLVRTLFRDDSLVLTIRGRKYTPKFTCNVNGKLLEVESVQTEVDAGYEGKDKIVLIEAKNSATKNTIIRQLYYPFRQWSMHTRKEVFTVFFEKRKDEYHFWVFGFADPNEYTSIRLLEAKRFKITT